MSTVHAGRWDTRQKYAVKLVPNGNNRCMRARDVLCVQRNAGSTYRGHDTWWTYGRDKTINESTVRTPQAKQYYSDVKTRDSYGNQMTPTVGNANGHLVSSLDVVGTDNISEGRNQGSRYDVQTLKSGRNVSVKPPLSLADRRPYCTRRYRVNGPVL